MNAQLKVLPAAQNRAIPDLFSLKGRVALVTGGAGRYGRAISRALAEAGATVIIASRNKKTCEEYAEVLSREDFDAHGFALNASENDSVQSVASRIELKWGRIDVLFNNAVSVHAEPLCEHSVEKWAQAVDINAKAVYRMCMVFGEVMAKHGAGSIVNVASIYGVVSPDFRIYDGHSEMTNPPSYGFVKAGMIQLTRYLAVYFGSRGVRVNSLSPGGLFSAGMPVEFVLNYARRVPLGRMASANDIAGAAVFLASDASAYVTGQNLLVDGGYTAL
ncbi:MAG TPA: SDR family oxidoreductase [Candidatus Acidoferrales bacterium]|nr:SDR family oxidoreductase [Candidatus Acidoferrales bacterium]